jgi:hypothetical protein
MKFWGDTDRCDENAVLADTSFCYSFSNIAIGTTGVGHQAWLMTSAWEWVRLDGLSAFLKEWQLGFLYAGTDKASRAWINFLPTSCGTMSKCKVLNTSRRRVTFRLTAAASNGPTAQHM